MLAKMSKTNKKDYANYFDAEKAVASMDTTKYIRVMMNTIQIEDILKVQDLGNTYTDDLGSSMQGHDEHDLDRRYIDSSRPRKYISPTKQYARM